jgi:hypothetical protein
MSNRNATFRRGKHFGWWVIGRFSTGRLFMVTWWPTKGLADTVARWVRSDGE